MKFARVIRSVKTHDDRWVAEPGNTTRRQPMVKVIAGPTPQQAKLVNHIYLLILILKPEHLQV